MTLWKIALIVGGLFGVIGALLGISRQLEQLIRVQIHQRELLQTAIERGARENSDNWYRLHEALLASGAKPEAADDKR